VEGASTEERRLAGRRRFACLPAPWHLADFDFEAQPKLDRYSPQPIDHGAAPRCHTVDSQATIRPEPRRSLATVIGETKAESRNPIGGFKW
jgi:hypothetical protein